MGKDKIMKCCLILFILIYGSGCDPYHEERANQDRVAVCKAKLSIGMAYNQVLEKIGPPFITDVIEIEGRKMKWLYFPSPRFAATAIQCLIDIESNRVERIICDDGYDISANR